MSRYRSRASLTSPLVRYVQRHYQVSRLYRPAMPQMGGPPAAPQEFSLAGTASAVPTARPTGVVQAKLLPQTNNLPMGMVVGMGAPTPPVSQNLPVQAEFETQAPAETSAPQAAPTFWRRLQNLVRPQPQKPQAAAPSQRSLPIQAAPLPTPAPGPASSPAPVVQRAALPAEPGPVIQPTQEPLASAPNPPTPAVPLAQQRPVQAARPALQAQPAVQTPPKTAAPTPSRAIQTAAEPAESEENSGTDPKTWNRLQNIFQRHQEKQTTQAGGDAPPVQTRREEEPSQPISPEQPAQKIQRAEAAPEETQVFQRPTSEMPAPAQPTETAPSRTSAAPQHSAPVQKVAQPAVPSAAPTSQGPSEPPTPTQELDNTAPEAPLEMAWPVQRKNTPESAPAPTTPTPTPTTLLPLAGEDENGAGTLQNILSGVEAGRPTDSKIEVIPPRRSRPTSAPVQRTADQVSPEPAQQSQPGMDFPTTIQREPAGAPETMVPTEVGSLPADLWQLIGETPPRQPARPTASSGQSSGPVQAAPQTPTPQAALAPSLAVPNQVSSPSPAQPYRPAPSQPVQRSGPTAQNAAPEQAQSASPIQTPPQSTGNIQREMLPQEAAKTSAEITPTPNVFPPASQPTPVQREETQAPVSSSSSQAPAGTPTPAGSGAPVDTEELARKVYAELKRKLMVEWERNRFYANPRKR